MLSLRNVTYSDPMLVSWLHCLKRRNASGWV